MIRIERMIRGLGPIVRKAVLPLGMMAALNGCSASSKNVLDAQLLQLRNNYSKQFGCIGIGVYEIGPAGLGFARKQAEMLARDDYARKCLGEKLDKIELGISAGKPVVIIAYPQITNKLAVAIAGNY